MSTATDHLPRRGWSLLGVTDSMGGGHSRGQFDTCQLCGNEQVRYVHTLYHPNVPQPLDVGCVCAEHLCGDYGPNGPRAREKHLRNRAARRKNWLTREWRVSMKGNLFLNVDGTNFVVYPTRFGRWGYSIDGTRGVGTFATQAEAHLAAFDAQWPADSSRAVAPSQTDPENSENSENSTDPA